MISSLAIFGNLGMTEILLILAVVLILFGSAKIPALMRSMGSGINEFKKGLKEGDQEATAEAKKDEAAKPSETAMAKPAEPEKK